MKHKVFISAFLLAASTVAMWSCRKEFKPTKGTDLNPKQDVFSVDYNTANNGGLAMLFPAQVVDNNMAALGRLLFYDTRLSISGTVSCASCHKQNLAFADNVPFSDGFAKRKTTLNSMAINNPGFDFAYFWKGRANSLKDLALMPVANHIEMGIIDQNEIANAIKNVPMYQEYFNSVFGSGDPINNTNIASSIAEFLKSIQGFDSKFDIATRDMDFNLIQTENIPTFSAMENKGKHLFFEKYNCVACHGTNSQITAGWGSGSFANIGLDEGNDNDPSGQPWFKAPNLRNIELTGPYMHDGRFKTLEDVLEHYSSGIKNNPNLSWELRDFDNKTGKSVPKKFNITQDEKKAIIAFLKTLTNHNLISDKRFSNPFLY